MKYDVRMLVIALILGGWGLMATGCDEVEEVLDDLSGEEEEEAVAEDDDDDDEEEDDEEEEVAEDDEDEPKFNQGMFILAASEAGCVDQEIDDEEQGAEIKEEIFARYGFTEDSFEEAQEYFDGEDAVEIAVDASLEQCTEEMALGLGEAGAEQFVLEDLDAAGEFVVASFVVRCMDEELDDDDDEVTEAFLDHLGYTEDSFGEAQDEYDGVELIEANIDAAMDRCDEDVATGLALAGPEIFDDGEVDVGAFGTDEFSAGFEKLAAASQEVAAEAEEEEEEIAEEDEAEEVATPTPAPTPEPPMTGTITASISGSDFEDTTLEIRVRSNFDVNGRLRGDHEGRGFQVPFSGTVSEDGVIRARGDRGGNNIEVEGRLRDNAASGTISGTVHQRDYRLRYTAN